VAAALTRTLETHHRVLDELVEQRVTTASLVKGYLAVTREVDDETSTEFYARVRQDELTQRMDELTELTGQELVSMHPAAKWSREILDAGVARNRTLIARGVRVRSMHAQIMLSDPLVREYVKTWDDEGIEVRVTPAIPTRMLIYDRKTAILQADPYDVSSGAVLLRGGSVVRSLAAIYDHVWMTASEPADVPRSLGSGTLTDQQRAVLHLLATGAKDGAIARSLGVSTRTVTRLVAEIAALLGTTSRFQAGVRAARLGWLD
jgi:DNA-binding CsgD family transcriptional regulator